MFRSFHVPQFYQFSPLPLARSGTHQRAHRSTRGLPRQQQRERLQNSCARCDTRATRGIRDPSTRATNSLHAGRKRTRRNRHFVASAGLRRAHRCASGARRDGGRGDRSPRGAAGGDRREELLDGREAIDVRERRHCADSGSADRRVAQALDRIEPARGKSRSRCGARARSGAARARPDVTAASVRIAQHAAQARDVAKAEIHALSASGCTTCAASPASTERPAT